MMNYKVELNDIRADLLVGIEEIEHVKPQAVTIDIVMVRGVTADYAFNNIGDCMDYSHIYRYINEAWTNKPHTPLLENLATELLDFVFKSDKRVEKCAVTLSKPDIFNGQAVPSVSLERSR